MTSFGEQLAEISRLARDYFDHGDGHGCDIGLKIYTKFAQEMLDKYKPELEIYARTGESMAIFEEFPPGNLCCRPKNVIIDGVKVRSLGTCSLMFSWI